MGLKDPCFRYEGPLNLHSDSKEKVMAGGKYLMVNDDQIKPLMEGRSLYEYAVKITMAPRT